MLLLLPTYGQNTCHMIYKGYSTLINKELYLYLVYIEVGHPFHNEICVFPK